jgi:sulfoquinovosidase
VSPAHLRFEISAEADKACGINRIILRSASSLDEDSLGFGEQLTYFNQKGNVLPHPPARAASAGVDPS